MDPKKEKTCKLITKLFGETHEIIYDPNESSKSSSLKRKHANTPDNDLKPDKNKKLSMESTSSSSKHKSSEKSSKDSKSDKSKNSEPEQNKKSSGESSSSSSKHKSSEKSSKESKSDKNKIRETEQENKFSEKSSTKHKSSEISSKDSKSDINKNIEPGVSKKSSEESSSKHKSEKSSKDSKSDKQEPEQNKKDEEGSTSSSKHRSSSSSKHKSSEKSSRDSKSDKNKSSEAEQEKKPSKEGSTSSSKHKSSEKSSRDSKSDENVSNEPEKIKKPSEKGSSKHESSKKSSRDSKSDKNKSNEAEQEKKPSKEGSTSSSKHKSSEKSSRDSKSDKNERSKTEIIKEPSGEGSSSSSKHKSSSKSSKHSKSHGHKRSKSRSNSSTFDKSTKENGSKIDLEVFRKVAKDVFQSEAKKMMNICEEMKNTIQSVLGELNALKQSPCNVKLDAGCVPQYPILDDIHLDEETRELLAYLNDPSNMCHDEHFELVDGIYVPRYPCIMYNKKSYEDGVSNEKDDEFCSPNKKFKPDPTKLENDPNDDESLIKPINMYVPSTSKTEIKTCSPPQPKQIADIISQIKTEPKPQNNTSIGIKQEPQAENEIYFRVIPEESKEDAKIKNEDKNTVNISTMNKWTSTIKKDHGLKTKEAFQSMMTDNALFCLFKCMGFNCCYTTSSYDNFLKHLNIHSKCSYKLKDFYLYCPYCRFEGNSPLNLIEHYKTHHYQCIYQCNLCFYRSAEKQSVYDHQVYYHSSLLRKSKILEGVSNDFLLQNEELQERRAVLKVKNIKESMICDVCNKNFIVPDDLVDHLTKNHQQEEELPKAQKQIEEMKMKIYKNRIGKYQCLECQPSTPFGSNNRIEMRAHLHQHPRRLHYVCLREPDQYKHYRIASRKDIQVVKYVGDLETLQNTEGIQKISIE